MIVLLANLANLAKPEMWSQNRKCKKTTPKTGNFQLCHIKSHKFSNLRWSLLSPQYFFDRKYRNNNKNPLCGYSAVRIFSTFSKEREHFEQTWHKWSNPQKYWEDNTVIVLTQNMLAFGSRSAPCSQNNLLLFPNLANLATKMWSQNQKCKKTTPKKQEISSFDSWCEDQSARKFALHCLFMHEIAI